MTQNECFICGESTKPMHARDGKIVQVDEKLSRPVRFNPKKDRVHVCKSKHKFTQR